MKGEVSVALVPVEPIAMNELVDVDLPVLVPVTSTSR